VAPGVFKQPWQEDGIMQLGWMNDEYLKNPCFICVQSVADVAFSLLDCG
jgi:hypothetical protein